MLLQSIGSSTPFQLAAHVFCTLGANGLALTSSKNLASSASLPANRFLHQDNSE